MSNNFQLGSKGLEHQTVSWHNLEKRVIDRRSIKIISGVQVQVQVAGVKPVTGTVLECVPMLRSMYPVRSADYYHEAKEPHVALTNVVVTSH